MIEGDGGSNSNALHEVWRRVIFTLHCIGTGQGYGRSGQNGSILRLMNLLELLNNLLRLLRNLLELAGVVAEVADGLGLG